MNESIMEKYPVTSITIVNGVGCTHYDIFREWIKALKAGFIAQKEYQGYPELPDCWMDGMSLYVDAPDHEKAMMALALMTEMTEAFRHWKKDRDDLHGPDGWMYFWEGV